MPDSTMDGLPAAAALTGAEILPMVQGGSDRRDTLNSILAFIQSQLPETIDDRVAALLVDGTNISLDYVDGSNTLTISAADTNLSNTPGASSVTVISSTGSDTVIPAATVTEAGVLTAADKSKLDGIAVGATANATNAFLLDRANHTSTQTAATISDFSEAVDDRVSSLLVQGTNITLTYDDGANTLTIDAAGGAGSTNLSSTVAASTVTVNSDTGTDAVIPAATTSDAGVLTAADKTKLDGIASGATANSADATLLDRANHTGTQLLTTISDVTVTSTNLNALDDGTDTALHFHTADRARANHTGTQAASTISDFSEAVDDRVAALLVQGTNITLTYDDGANTLTIDSTGGSGSTNLSPTVGASTVTINSDTGTDATIPAATTSDAGVMTAADKTKLDGIAAGATANSADATLLARANHTGTQLASTISDFSEAVDDRVAALLVQGTNITLTYDDGANTLTIDAAAGAGQAGVQFQDEGSNLGTSGTATVVDFVGAGVTASRVSNTVTVTIPGGGGQAGIQFQEEGSNLGSSGTATSFNVVGPSATLSRSTDAITLTIQATQGRHSIPILAGSMRPSVTGGCASLATIASAANQPDIQTLDFDTTTQEYAQFSIPMPKSWDEGTVTFAPIWSHASTTTNFGVVWDLQAVAVSNDDGIAVAFGTAQTSTDTGGTTNDVYIGPESSAITVAGTPAAEDVVFFRLSRVTGNGSDTLAIDARLHGIVLYITTDAENDA